MIVDTDRPICGTCLILKRTPHTAPRAVAASWWASNPERPEDGRWPVCDGCRAQAQRTRASVKHTPI